MAAVKTGSIQAWPRGGHGLLPLLVVALAFGCLSGYLPGKATLGGGRVASDGYAISGPCLLLRDGRPGVAFGTYATPNAPDALGYVVVFKYPPGSLVQSGFAPRGSARSQANGLLASLELDLHGVQLSIAYQVKPNDAHTGIGSEMLSIQDKPVDVAEGRFFYVDLTARPFRIEQKDLPLPTVTANTEHAEEVERVAEEALRVLKASALPGRHGGLSRLTGALPPPTMVQAFGLDRLPQAFGVATALYPHK